MADSTPNNPDQGVGFENEPQLETSLPARRLYPHVFPANKAAWNRYRGPLPQLGSVLQIFKKPS